MVDAATEEPETPYLLPFSCHHMIRASASPTRLPYDTDGTKLPPSRRPSKQVDFHLHRMHNPRRWIPRFPPLPATPSQLRDRRQARALHQPFAEGPMATTAMANNYGDIVRCLGRYSRSAIGSPSPRPSRGMTRVSRFRSVEGWWCRTLSCYLVFAIS
jgi:hypothetical protein